MYSSHPFWSQEVPRVDGQLLLTPCPGTQQVPLTLALDQLRLAGAHGVVTLMTSAELTRLELAPLGQQVEHEGMRWFHLPIEDDLAPDAAFEAAWQQALPQLRELPYIELYGCDTTRDNKTGIIAFNVKDVHPHDVASILDSYGVAIRAGHHCAQPLHRYLGQNASCRASFYLYNTREDIDRWIDALKKVRGVLGYGA